MNRTPTAVPLLEELKVKLAFFEKLFFAGLAIVVILSGWIASNYDKTSVWILLGAVIAFFLTAIGMVIVYRNIKTLFKAIGKC